MALRAHPFAVSAFFRRSLVLAYALPAEALAPHLGPGLRLDTYMDADGAPLGFVAIALVETEQLRPSALPALFGRSFFLSGYRIFSRFERAGKPSLRGLKILRSDTDSAAMARLGRIFTQYNYERASIAVEAPEGALGRYAVSVRTRSGEGDLDVAVQLAEGPAPLPAESPFRSAEDARRFAGPLPYTFSWDAALGKMVVVRGLREAWGPRPVAVERAAAAFLERRFPGVRARLANAFYVENIPYAWRAGELCDLDPAETP